MQVISRLAGCMVGAFKPGSKGATRYKLFTEPTTRDVVLHRLVAQLGETNTIRDSPAVQLCLAAGKIVASEAERLQEHFNANNWQLYGPDWIREQLRAVADDGYDNAIAAVTAKLLLRE